MATRTKKRTHGPNAWYGWRPDLPDARDHLFLPPESATGLAESHDLRPKAAPVVDQGQLGSCTANAIAAAHMFDQIKLGNTPVFQPSRLFIYYNERVMEGTVSEDAGAFIRDGIKSINKQGVCPETNWPYNINKFTNKPTTTAYALAKKHCAVSYSRIRRNLTSMKHCLMDGYPFVLGFTVYESFESSQMSDNGRMPMPAQSESVLGGHAVLCVGYINNGSAVGKELMMPDGEGGGHFIVQNSWGTDWGDKGFFYMPYGYLLNEDLSDDFWVVKAVR